MRLSLCLCFAFLFAVAPAARGQEGKIVLDTWQAGYYEGLKVGHTHTTVREIKDGATVRYRTDRSMHLTIKRYGSVIPVNVEQSSEESADGKVLAISSTQVLAMDKKATIGGKVANGQITVTLPDGKSLRLPWDDKVLGMYAQQTAFKRNKAKPGDKLVISSFEPLLLAVVTIRTTVKEMEKTDRLVLVKKDGKEVIGREEIRLLRVEGAPDEVRIGKQVVPLPKQTVWLDADLMPVRDQFDFPGLGLVTFYTTTKDAALKDGVAPDLLPDLGLTISIPVRKSLDNPYKVDQAVYKITLKDDIKDVFSSDTRQEIRNLKGRTFELVVKAQRSPAPQDGTVADKEYLQSNYFVDSDNHVIKKSASKAIGKETDPWKQAQTLEKWVHDNMKVSTSVGFPVASRIACDLEGDCRQHALLLAAMCRAVGVPSRTALGLIYVQEPGKTAIFGFHMWTEVRVRGQWLGLDAVLGRGNIGATHLKMSDHSWSGAQTLAPLLPVSQVLGKVEIEILSAR